MKILFLVFAVFACFLISGCPIQDTGVKDISVVFVDVTANGSAETVTTTMLTLTFDMDITDINADDINITAGLTNVTKGLLTRTGTGIYNLDVGGITAGGQITVAVSKTGYNITGGSKSVNVHYSITGGVFSITFAQITDSSPSISGPTIYRSEDNGPTKIILTVDNPGQYTGINWYVNGITGIGASFALNSANTAYNNIGEQLITVEVIKNGITYNKTIVFMVAD